MTLPKVIQAITLLTFLFLASCQTSDLIIHKDGLRDAVTTPLTESIDEQTDKFIHELELNKLTKRLEELTAKLSNTADSSNELIEEITKLVRQINELMPKVQSIADEAEATITSISTQFKESTSQSVQFQLLPIIIIVIAVLVAILIITLVLRKKKNES